MNVAKLTPHKQTFEPLVQYYAYALSESGVNVRLNEEGMVNTLRAMNPDITIIATGSQLVLPGFCQGTGAIVAQDVLQGKATGQAVLVLGGGLVGSEPAEFLAEKGKQVTILELRDNILIKDSIPSDGIAELGFWNQEALKFGMFSQPDSQEVIMEDTTHVRSTSSCNCEYLCKRIAWNFSTKRKEACLRG